RERAGARLGVIGRDAAVERPLPCRDDRVPAIVCLVLIGGAIGSAQDELAAAGADVRRPGARGGESLAVALALVATVEGKDLGEAAHPDGVPDAVVGVCQIIPERVLLVSP